MKTLKLLLLFVLAFPLVAAAQMADPPPAPWTPWWDRPVVGDMNLTAEQREQIRNIVSESREPLVALRNNVAEAEKKLNDEMNAEQLDTAGAEAAITTVIAARSELMRAISQMSLKLRQLLTREQWQRLQGPRRGRRPMGGPPQGGMRRPWH